MATQIVHRVDISRLHHEHVVKFDQATSRIKVMRTLHNYFSQATTCTHVLIAKLVALPQNVGILFLCTSLVFPQLLSIPLNCIESFPSKSPNIYGRTDKTIAQRERERGRASEV